MKALACGAIAILMLSSCGSRVRNWDEQLAVQQQGTSVTQSSTTIARTTETTERHATGRTTTTTRAVGPTTTVRSSLPHPAPGRYTYDIVSHYPALEDEPASDDSDTYEVTWTVEGSADALSLVESDDGSTTKYRVTPGAMELQSIRYEDDEDVYNCTYKPAQTLFKLPLTNGAKWSSDSSCTYEDGELDRVLLQSEVTGTATDTIGGVTVSTFVIRWTDTTTEKYPDDDEPDVYKAVHTAHVDPKTLLIVSEEVRDDSEPGYEIVSTRKLKSLTPK